MVKAFCEQGHIDINTILDSGRTGLMQTAARWEPEMVSTFLQLGAPVSDFIKLGPATRPNQSRSFFGPRPGGPLVWAQEGAEDELQTRRARARRSETEMKRFIISIGFRL